MKIQSLFPLLALALASTAHAADGSPSFGVSAGGYFTDELQAIGDTVSIHLRGGYWIDPTVGVELDLGFMPFGNTQVGTPDPLPYFGMTPRVNLTGRVFEDKPLQLLLTVGAGAIVKNIDDPDDTLGLPTENVDVDILGAAGPGLFVPLGKSGIGLRTDFNWLLNVGTENWQNHGDQFIDYEWTGGIAFLPGGPKDADKDGILDESDSCVDSPEDIDEFEDGDGCPETDNDKDGIPDADDACALDPEDIDNWEDTDGCPELDNDGDGINDADDTCPDQKGTAATKGCPDTDGDGLADNDPGEMCPNEAGPAASEGCPDADGDLVPDVRDQCPNEKANEGVDPRRSDGCPSKAFVSDGAIIITEKVQFDSGKATIKKESHDLLDTVYKLLEKNKGIQKVQVEGHTDAQGNDAANLKLSQARSEAVVAYLVAKGIAAERLAAKGFGETVPLGDNNTAAGREQNRRVEFKIEADDMSKGVKKKMKESEAVDGKETPPEKPAEAPAPAPAEKPAETPADAKKE